MATAFAVYSADDKSLNFYKRDTVPTAGSSFNGKTATAVYTGIETKTYRSSTQPWKSYQSSITSVSIVDSGIAPVSTAYWFYKMNNASLTTIGGLDKLDTSKVTTMDSMFRNCSALTSLDVSSFNTANVTNMRSMFEGCTTLSAIYAGNGWSTANVTSSSLMFANCSKLPNFSSSKTDKTNAHYNSGGYLTPLGITYYVWSGMGINASDYICEAYRYAKSNGTIEKQVASGIITRDAYTDDSVTLTATFSEDWAAAQTETITKSGFAVYSADDNSLSFYKRIGRVSVGDSFNGKTVTVVYTGIETDTYDSLKYEPWSKYASSITSVNFVDSGIAPVSTAYWFFNMSNDSLTTISGLNKLDTSKVTTMDCMFFQSKFTSLDVSHFDTTNVTNMYCMFGTCRALTSLDLSHFDTSKVTNMDCMFQNCQSLTSLDLSSFNTSNVTNMDGMFIHCSALTSLDVSSFNTANVTNMSNMFYCCQALTSLDLSHFDTSKVTTMSNMFSNCTALISLDLSGWNTSNVTNMSAMFSWCPALSVIYAGNGWSTAKVPDGDSMFDDSTKLPNFNSSVVDKTNAHYGSGGYLTYKPPTIVFVANSGLFQSDSSTTKSVQTNLDGTISLSTLVEFPTKSGYVFRGWSTSSTGVVVYTPHASPTITEDTTLYAVWQKAESYLIREDTLVNIANAVRAKTGGTDAIALGDMATMIAAIQSGALDAPKYIGSYKCYINTGTSYQNVDFYDNINGRENAAIYSSTRYIPTVGDLGNAVIEVLRDAHSGNPAWLLSNVTGDSQIRLFAESGGSK